MAVNNAPRTPMPEQPPQQRVHNFNEVALGFTEEQAKQEASRCLHCPNPMCVQGCPVNVRIPEFIAKVSEGDFEGAYQVITDTNGLPPSPAASAPRSASARPSACGASRASPWPSAGWSGLWPTGTWLTPPSTPARPTP